MAWIVSPIRPTLTDTALFFATDPPTTQIYTLSLHDALPIFHVGGAVAIIFLLYPARKKPLGAPTGDRKSTRLNSSHVAISYAVFCLKKKKISSKTIVGIRTMTRRTID